MVGEGKQQEQRKWHAQAMCPAWRGKLLSWRLNREQDGKQTASVRLMGNRSSNPKWNMTILCSKHRGMCAQDAPLSTPVYLDGVCCLYLQTMLAAI